MTIRLRQGCFAVVLIVAAVGVTAYLCVRTDLRRFNQFVDTHSSPVYSATILRTIVAIEDPAFFRRSRFDTIQQIIRTFTTDLRNRAPGPDLVLDSGASLTQQLVRAQSNRGRELLRPIILCAFLDLTQQKDKVLAAYANDVYFGMVEDRQVRGVDNASRVYFAKPPDLINSAEIASLVATIRHPTAYAPSLESEKAVRRRLQVLERMERQRIVSLGEAAEARELLSRPKRRPPN